MKTGHGGARKGAGRPKGQGKYGESTKLMHIPLSLTDSVLDYITCKGYRVPLYSSGVSAGEPLPADDDIEEFVDLSRKLIRDPASAFLCRADGTSMNKAGIVHGDWLLGDRGLEARAGKIVVAVVNGGLTVKRFTRQDGKTRLMPESTDKHPIIDIGEATDGAIVGVITKVIKNV